MYNFFLAASLTHGVLRYNMVGCINIIGSENLKKLDCGGIGIAFNDKQYTKSLCVCPNGQEHFDSIDLLKLRIHCDRTNTKLTVHGQSNYLPYYSIFADEAVFFDSFLPTPTYYGDHFSDIHNKCDKLPDDPWKHLVGDIANKDVIERFWDWNVSILDSAYRIWKSEILTRNLTVFEAKFGCCIEPILEALDVVGAKHKFQQSLLPRVGLSNYMSCQLLSSHLLNWCYVCCGGVSNLFSVLPMRVALLCDHSMGYGAGVAQELYSRRYGNRNLLVVIRENCYEPRSAGIICQKWREINKNAEEIKSLLPPKLVDHTTW